MAFRPPTDCTNFGQKTMRTKENNINIF